MKRSMVKIVFGITLLMIIFVGCYNGATGDDSAVGSGRIISEERNVTECTGIILRGAGNVYLTQDTVQAIRIEADDNIIQKVITKNENGVLVAGLKQGNYSNINVKIYVTLASVEQLSIEGAGNINGADILQKNDLFCAITGTGNISLNGSGNNLHCTINGAGNIDAKKFITNRCSVSVSGAGDCVVYVTDELNAVINGIGTVFYYGNTQRVTRSITGVGQVIRK